MKFKLFLAAAALALSASAETPFINLTPAPVEMTVGEGSYALKPGLTISALGHDAEISRFIAALDAATGLAPQRVEAGAAADITVLDINCAADHYELTVGADGVTIGCSGDEGLYYAFQTLKKILPANVMAGVREEKEYSLPLLTIKDEPRLDYRGFMLDVSRHFFTVDEVKRMIEVMSYYKMNKFHWHLTDDQGWRIEMPDYPRLTTVGATASNTEVVDMYTKTDYWLNKTYGPYFYTQDELRDVVAYAAERHIDIIPEVEMPGHFSAVMAAYPEFSLNPAGGHSVAVTGGVYGDVMNLANPAAIKFAEDVIDVLADIFPSEIIHIGGDECPDGGWVKLTDGKVTGGNDECRAMYAREGCTHPRQLQSIFTKHMADYAATKGRKIGVWNESISAAGTDEERIRQTDATVWCWTGADGAVNKAVNLGLKAIYTPINKSGDTKGSFYINRSQNPNDPPANGNKVDDVKSVYNTIPFTVQALKKNPDLCYGVQGTFWCERVAYREYLEYLALPRLLAIAEIGWTPEKNKSWESFQKRMSADRELLEYNGYKYSTYHMLDVPTTEPEPKQPLTALEAGATYYFENTAPTFAGSRLSAQPLQPQARHYNSTTFFSGSLWTVTEVTPGADNSSMTLKLKHQSTNKFLASAGESSGRNAKPVSMGDVAAEITVTGSDNALQFSLGDDIIWLSPDGSVRAGETKSGGGVSPLQGTTWRAIKGEKRIFNLFLNGEKYSTSDHEIPVGVTDFAPYAPELPAFALKTATLNDRGEVDCNYEATAEQILYTGYLENGTQIYYSRAMRPLGSTELTIPQVEGFTLVATDEPKAQGLQTIVRSTYTTTAHIGAKEASQPLTGLEAGKQYLIRDAHSDRNAWRGATSAGTVSGAKTVAGGLSPMFVWTLEGADGKFKVKNLATGTYVSRLERSQTAKLAASGETFTWTYDADHWNVKGSNGMYWDGLDNLDLVGWNGGTGHPIEVYDFIGAPFYAVTVNSVDNKGNRFATETKYAPAGEPFVLGLPYRKNYTITSVEGADELKKLTSDVTVTIVYTRDTELSIGEIESATDATGAFYDLQGRRILNPRSGLYIQNGRKLLIK